MSDPAPTYTHLMHARRCADAAESKTPLRQYVQVSFQGAPTCGIIRDAFDDSDGKPMWKVDCIGDVKGRMNFPVRLVRQCSGLDGRCQCEQAKI